MPQYEAEDEGPFWEEEEQPRRPASPQGSGWVLAVAITNIIGGGLLTLGGLCTSGVSILILAEMRNAHDRTVLLVTLAVYLVGLLLGVGILVSGIGMLGRHRWSRTLGLVMSTCGFGVGGLGIIGLLIGCLLEPPRRGEDLLGFGILCFLDLVCWGYSLFIVLILRRPQVARLFR
jgi:hypothetical protein